MQASTPVTPRRTLVAVAVALSSSVLAHLLFGAGYARWVIMIEALVVALACLGWAVRVKRHVLLALLWLALAAILVVSAAASRLPFYVPSVTINLLLAWLFGHTLVGRGEALISRIARIEHDGELDEPTLHYTRTLTAVWCGFFLLSAAVSGSLALFASPTAWSWFANVANFPLAIVFFAAEYGYRCHRFRDRSHASPLKTVARFAAASAALFKPHAGGSR